MINTPPNKLTDIHGNLSLLRLNQTDCLILAYGVVIGSTVKNKVAELLDDHSHDIYEWDYSKTLQETADWLRGEGYKVEFVAASINIQSRHDAETAVIMDTLLDVLESEGRTAENDIVVWSARANLQQVAPSLVIERERIKAEAVGNGTIFTKQVY
jgi:hypothetical protein